MIAHAVLAHAGAIALAATAAWLVARLAPRGRNAPGRWIVARLMVEASLLALLVSRLAYMARWWQAYVASPWSGLSLADGGFYGWIGLPIAVAYLLWRVHRKRLAWRLVLAPAAAGLAVWGMLQLGLDTLQPGTQGIPDLTLRTLDDSGAVALRAYGGKPLVLNVWATWCPPCRRELPAFAQAQQAYPGVNFVFADQGERAEVVATYLRRQGLQLYNVLLDRSMATMRATGVKALPNTLFFDARGRLVETQVGELSPERMRELVEGKLLR